MLYGVNTYGLNKMLLGDFENTMKELKKIGFDSIEPCVMFESFLGASEEMVIKGFVQAGFNGGTWLSSEFEEHMKVLRQIGLQVRGAHVALLPITTEQINDVADKLIDFAEKYQLEYYVYSPLKETIKEVEDSIPGLRKLRKMLSDKGIELLFHNHEKEFFDDDGDTVFDYILRQIPEMHIQLDVGWVQFAGRDVMELMHTYQKRISILHFKDVIPDADKDNRDHCFTAVGEGSIPLRKIMNYADELPLLENGFVIDQDDSMGSMIRDLREGYLNIRQEYER